MKIFGLKFLSLLVFIILQNSQIINAQSYHDAIRPFWSVNGFGTASGTLTNNTNSLSGSIYSLSANPAALGLVKQPKTSLSVQYNLLYQNSLYFYQNNNTEDSQNYLTFKGIEFVYPFPVYQGSFVMGISFTPSANYNYHLSAEDIIEDEYDGGTDTYYLKENIEESGQLNTFRLGASVEFQKNLLLGFSWNYHSGYREYRYSSTDIDTTDIYTYDKFYSTESITPEYLGWNFDLGLIYTAINFRFGLNISTPLKLETIEESTISTSESLEDMANVDTLENFNLNYNVTRPFEISPGIALTYDNVTMTFEAKIHNWQSIKFESELYDEFYDAELDSFLISSADDRINDNIHNNFETTIDFGFALIYSIHKNITLQTGYKIINNPLHNILDDKKQISIAGFGCEMLLGNQFTIGINYQLTIGTLPIDNLLFPVDQQIQDHQLRLLTSFKF